jgi:hypothetical protein
MVVHAPPGKFGARTTPVAEERATGHTPPGGCVAEVMVALEECTPGCRHVVARHTPLGGSRTGSSDSIIGAPSSESSTGPEAAPAP